MEHLKTWRIFESERLSDDMLNNILDKIKDRGLSESVGKKHKIFNLASYGVGNYCEAIYEYYYRVWKEHENDLRFDSSTWNYDDFLEFVRRKDHRLALVIMIMNYIGQVNNGGHSQYYFNGYASSGGRSFSSSHEDIQLHLDMMEYMEESGLMDVYQISKMVWDVMKEFSRELEDYNVICDMCHGAGEEEEVCSDCNGEGEDGYGDTCYECGGSGEVYTACEYCDGGETLFPDLDYLDSKFAKLDEPFMKVCNKFYKKVIDENFR